MKKTLFACVLICALLLGCSSGGGGGGATHTVTFNSNGGTAVSPITGVEEGDTITAPPDPIKGYAFEGWYKDVGLTDDWDFGSDTVTANITLYAKWGAYDGSLNIGDTGPGGGKIFYRPGTSFTMTGIGTCYYLEVAPADQGEFVWSETNADIDTGTTIGTGKNNTNLICSAHPGDDNAANACADYRGPNNFSDWFLPSKDELNELYIQKGVVGGFTTNNYWASSQNASNLAWIQYFGNGTQSSGYTKGSQYPVRAIRAF